MTESNLNDQIAAAAAYEELHVPALFEAWVEPVLDAANASSGQRVLDVACGTGVLARAAAERVGPHGTVAGVDPNPGMLAVAERLNGTVQWRHGVAEALPFPDASFDAVVSQFGLMFFTDRMRAVAEMLRVLVPGGALGVAVWDSLANSPAYAVEVELLERLSGPRAADALRAPFVLGDRQELLSLFKGAGVTSAEIISGTTTARFPSIRTMVEADLRGWLPVMGVELPEEKIEDILAEAESALAAFVRPEGHVVFDSPAHIVTGRKP
jgi:SAM-dependent methyltransferase